jgi:hypothetical protein
MIILISQLSNPRAEQPDEASECMSDTLKANIMGRLLYDHVEEPLLAANIIKKFWEELIAYFPSTLI